MAFAATFEEYSSVDSSGGENLYDFKSFGKRLIKRRSTNQEKRDISLSYAATNINNKEGTQVKTITVIKNLNDKNEKLKIDPKLHNNENWAEAFKDNFDSYGIIPDVPDVDDLFEYVNKKHNNDKEKENMKVFGRKKGKEEITTSFPKEVEKPVTEISAEISEEITETIKEVEKIKGDAELLPNFNSSRLKVRESLINLNYSAPGHTVHQYFDNYVQLSQGGKEVGGFNYLKPCIHSQPIGSVTVATPSGKTYNIPGNNNSYINPYLAPAITRRPQIAQQSTQAPATNGPVFPINSLVPPLQQQQNNNNPTLNNFLTQQTSASSGGNTQEQTQLPNSSLQPPFQNNFQNNQQQQPSQQNPQQSQNSFLSTSQRPYVSPNLRSGLSGVSRGPANANGFQNGQPGYRINTFNNAFKKSNNFRSRGLKY